MREIEFRGKQRWSGEWIYGELSQLKGSDWAWIKNDQYVQPVLPETIGQFTGEMLLGEKLFEGDLFRVRGSGMQHPFTVVWQNCGWEVDFGIGSRSLSSFFSMDICLRVERIGNLHDNP